MDLTALWDIDLGNFTIIDLIAATTNAFNGALLARQPSHYRKYTIVGIVLLAIFGGIGGGVSRDVLLNDIPSALTNPLYLILCAIAGYLADRQAVRLHVGVLAALVRRGRVQQGARRGSALPGVRPHRCRRPDGGSIPHRHHVRRDTAALRAR
jgi:hypothetical protein